MSVFLSNLGKARFSRMVSAVTPITLLALSTFAVAPGSAQSSASWSLDCTGNGMGAVSWNWLLDGAIISEAGGSVTCTGTMTLTGTNARPANANGFSATLRSSAGDKDAIQSASRSFDVSKPFQVKIRASASDRFCVQVFPDPSCIAWLNEHEGAHFALQG